MPTGLPKWAVEHDATRRKQELQEYAELSVEERWRRFLAASAWSWTLLRANPNREAALARRDAVSPEAWALWKSLVSAHRAR